MLPKLQDSAKLLYQIYIVITLIQVILLLLGGIPLFDALTISFGTMGTGGFSIKNDSLASYSTYCQIITAVFMLLGSINFNLYYFLVLREFGRAFKNEELRFYLGIILIVSLLIGIDIYSTMKSVGETALHSLFQVVSIISTTGFSTVDFDLWPQFSKALLVFLMCIGAMAGSTGGGIKASRIMIMMKSVRRDVYHAIRPNEMRLIHMDNEVVREETVVSVNHFILLYLLLTVFFTAAISIDNFGLETNLTAVLSCIGNVGPGLADVGPSLTFVGYSAFSKILLCIAMLLGRLELFPILILFVPSAWKK